MTEELIAQAPIVAAIVLIVGAFLRSRAASDKLFAESLRDSTRRQCRSHSRTAKALSHSIEKNTEVLSDLKETIDRGEPAAAHAD